MRRQRQQPKENSLFSRNYGVHSSGGESGERWANVFDFGGAALLQSASVVHSGGSETGEPERSIPATATLPTRGQAVVGWKGVRGESLRAHSTAHRTKQRMAMQRLLGPFATSLSQHSTSAWNLRNSAQSGRPRASAAVTNESRSGHGCGHRISRRPNDSLERTIRRRSDQRRDITTLLGALV